MSSLLVSSIVLSIAAVIQAPVEAAPASSQEFGNAPNQSTNTGDSKTTTTHKDTTTTHASTHATSSSSDSANKTSDHVSSSAVPTGNTSASSSSMVPTQTPTLASSSSASSPSASAPASNSGGGISTAAIGGLTAMAIIVVIGAGAFFLLRRSRRRNQFKKRANAMSVDPFTMGFGSSNPPTSQAPPMAAPLQQMYSQPTHPAPPTNDNTFPPPQAPAMAPVVPPADEPKPVGTYTVISTYTPTLGDELEIQPGDRVEVLVEYDDGWVTGRNISKGGVKGVFPKHCVDYATSPSQHEPTMLDAGGEDLGRTKRISSIYGAQ